MKKIGQSKKEIYFIVYLFIVVAVVAIISKTFSFYQMYDVSEANAATYKYTLNVSSSALLIKSDIYKIHKNMKDIVLAKSDEEVQKLIKEIELTQKNVYSNFDIIKNNISTNHGLTLLKETKDVFEDCQPVRDAIISLIDSNYIAQVIEIAKNSEPNHVQKLESLVSNLYDYMHNRADYLKTVSDENFKKLILIDFFASILLLISFILIVYYTINRISNYLYKNEHLNSVLSVIRDVNQIIIREKNIDKLIQEICDTLVSKHVFGSAWIVLYDNFKVPKYIYTTDKSQNADMFVEKIKSGWIPKCIEASREDSSYFIENSDEQCLECLLKDIHNVKSAFNLELKYKDKVFGYLTLRIDKKYIKDSDDKELLLEVAGDIAYALNNVEVEQDIAELQELYDNSMNSLENLFFAKDRNLIYLTCNRAFEKFTGKSKNEIIGKSDYDIFDKEFADFLSQHDEQILYGKASKLNYDWVTYPDGKRVYILTTKSPLLNSDGEIIGLVVNSVDITEQKKSQEALIESEKRFKQLMKESPSVMEVYDKDGLQIEVNRAYEVLWGFAATVTVNKFNLLKSKEVEKTGLLKYIEQAYAGESVTVPLYEFDSRGDTEAGEGRVRTLNTRIYPLKDSLGNVENIVILHEDVTDRERSLLELEQKKRELEKIIQEAPNPIMLHNEKGKVVLVNKAWKTLSGYSHSEIDTIEKWTQKAYGKEMPIVKEYIDKLYKLDAKTEEGEYSIFTKNGDTVIWQFSSAPLGVIDGSRVVISSAMDITELKKKDELMMAQSRHAAMGEMIGMIAHQWRQPISIVSMIANNMLLDTALGNFDANKADDYSKDILKQTEYLSKTIDDFRNYFKPDKSVSKINLKNIVDEVYSIVKDSLKNNSIRFETSYDSKTEVNGYPREVMQVIVNIINNAKDALVSNKTENALIEVNVFEDETHVNIKICDNGGEIKSEILPKIFDPYFTTKDEKNGTGIGLYISKMIVEDHLQGKIEVSNIKEGVCFIVKLLKCGEKNSADD